jgi:hypothetical protein
VSPCTATSRTSCSSLSLDIDDSLNLSLPSILLWPSLGEHQATASFLTASTFPHAPYCSGLPSTDTRYATQVAHSYHFTRPIVPGISPPSRSRP